MRRRQQHKPGPSFGPLDAGDAVEIVCGISKGLRGIVVGPTQHRFDGEIVYSVRLESGMERPIRRGFLSRLDGGGEAA